MFMGCAANAINYIDRANLAVAAPIIRHELGIDATVMGVILGAFFWTYAAMQMPFGWFADRVGARSALAAAVLWWSSSTSSPPPRAAVATLTGFRLLLGVGEAGAYPSGAKVNVTWFPRSERAIAASIFDSGSRIGAALVAAPGRLADRQLQLAGVFRGDRTARHRLDGRLARRSIVIPKTIPP